ncbi:MAG: hypothetical protein J4431_01235 [Candidatus Aenigmarchaeota archaeon]|nr:hypothetical protein [Candidatus Aenigmarchaeota archaeon]
MPILAVNFDRIDAKNSGKGAANVNVSSTPRISSVKMHAGLLGIKNVVSIAYSFETNYQPEVGSLTIEGEVLYNSDGAKEIAEKWDKEKKLDDDMTVEVLNAIFRRCLAKAVEICSDVRLPPPMQFPNVVKNEAKK